MARARRTDLIGKLADLSEEALQRIGDAPGADRLVGALNATRERVDDLQKRVRGLENLERRIATLERKVDKLGKGATSSTTTRRSTKTTSTKSSGATATRRSTRAKKS
jgi:hypothetical protein